MEATAPTLFEDLREHYLALVAATLAGTIYEDAPMPASGVTEYDPKLREYGWDWPSKAFTMIGVRRLANLRAVIESVIGEKVPGDIMETGVWRGGAGIMARAVLAAYGITDRRVILADSFAGLPPPDPEHYPADAGSEFHQYAELAVSLEEVRGNFARFGLLDERVVFLPGMFRDTLPHAPVERLAVLRLDGDMYESTILALDNLYDRVSPNGWVVIDDYEVVAACKQAVQDFLAGRGLTPELYPIDGVGVFFRKPFEGEPRLADAGSATSSAAFLASASPSTADLRAMLATVMRTRAALLEAEQTLVSERDRTAMLLGKLDASERALTEATAREADLRDDLARTVARLDRLLGYFPIRMAYRLRQSLRALQPNRPTRRSPDSR